MENVNNIKTNILISQIEKRFPAFENQQNLPLTLANPLQVQNSYYQKLFSGSFNGILGTDLANQKLSFWLDIDSSIKKKIKKQAIPSSFKFNLHTFPFTQSTYIAQTSGTVSCAAITNSGAIFVGSMAEDHVDYNRIGELIYLKDGTLKYLKGHSITCEQSGEVLRQTVSDVKYCSKIDATFTLGYDGAIRIWDEEHIPNPIGEYFTTNKSRILPSVSKHNSQELLAFATMDRTLYTFRYDCNKEGKMIKILQKGSFSKDPSHDLMDCLEFGPNGEIYAAIGYSSGKRAGLGEKYCLETSKRLFTFQIPNYNVSCINLDPENHFLAVGTGQVTDECESGDGIAHILDSISGKQAFQIVTRHQDCDALYFSQCGRFLASLNHIDSKGSIFDVRFPSSPLVSIDHSSKEGEKCENITSGRWSSVYPGVFYCGGADGCVKLWDVHCKNGQDIPLATFYHDNSINVIHVEEQTESKIVVGTLNDVTVHSIFEESLDHVEYY